MDYMVFTDEGGARGGIEPVVTSGVRDERLGPGRRGAATAAAALERGVKRIEEGEMARFSY